MPLLFQGLLTLAGGFQRKPVVPHTLWLPPSIGLRQNAYAQPR